MSSADARAALEAQQAALVRALTGQGAPPPGFDPDRVGAAAASLLRKRLRAVADAWPGLAAALGDDFAGRFLAYARRMPLPARGGALTDGRAFARELARAGALPDAGRLEALAVDVRFSSAHDGLVRRRGPAVRFAWLQRRALAVALRWPGWGEQWFTLGLGSSRD